MFAQEPPPDFDVPGRREPGERPELVAEVGLVEVACATLSRYRASPAFPNSSSITVAPI
jgi:hypothetical protein